MTIRLSSPADVPVLRELWALAFGDSGPYMDNFFDNYYRPERMIVLELDGRVRAMTAWFDTVFSVPCRGEYRAAYLYAVATHPDFRSRGLSAALLAWADDYFRLLEIPAVTTVPAEPSLHRFFGANGFRECFCHDELSFSPTAPCPQPHFALRKVSARTYGEVRRALLMGTSHICLPQDALDYQAGCCAVSGGGLYTADTGCGPVALCAEGMADGSLLVKELLGQPSACEEVVQALPALLPNCCGKYRIPGKTVLFGMLKWLDKKAEERWNWADTAYLGLAFD